MENRVMTLTKIAEHLNLKEIYNTHENCTCTQAYCSDLLSDIMGNAKDESILITIQAHKNTVAVASLKDSPAIIICNNRPIPQDMIDACKDEEIALFVSKDNQFEVSATLYSCLHGAPEC